MSSLRIYQPTRNNSSRSTSNRFSSTSTSTSTSFHFSATNPGQVRNMLADDPGNVEFVDMEKELEEVIALTRELLITAKQTPNPGFSLKSNTDILSAQHLDRGNTQFESSSSYLSELHTFSVGMKVQAVYSEDGEWYNATIEALTPNGYYVIYDGWGNKEEVDPGNVRSLAGGNEDDTVVDTLAEAEKQAEATKLAIKRKIAKAAEVDLQSRDLPAKLRIDPNDPDDVKAAKRKKIHSFKSKVRFEQIEVAQNKRQNAWQQFQTVKGKSKKTGFLSGRKRESIFKSPDDLRGKVGVTGSGKGLTEFQKREKHLHLKAGNMDLEEQG